jgi:non-ribosomal peptide synthetase component F
LNVTPIYQVVFTLQNAPREARRLKGLEISGMPEQEHNARFELMLHAVERKSGLEFACVYMTDVFDRWRIEQMMRHYIRVLEAMLADPEQAIEEVDLLGEEEQQQLLSQWSSAE